MTYLISKMETGFHNLWVQYTSDLSKIDWEKKRTRREEFVYDSGCLHCHKNLERATMGSNRAFVAHKPYFLKTTKKKCVTCHQNVGHKELIEKLPPLK
jgi:cytochrome c-type protein NapC